MFFSCFAFYNGWTNSSSVKSTLFISWILLRFGYLSWGLRGVLNAALIPMLRVAWVAIRKIKKCQTLG
jgi:hypothetical protein